jgi:membrane-associated protein
LGDMSSLLSILLHEPHKYGYPILWLIIFMAAVGLPLPASLVLLAAGAFAAHGDFNIALLMGITITAASCGDSVGYFIGRCWGSKTLDWLGQPRRLQLISPRTITRSRHYFKCKGGWAIFFSRSLFSALGGVMNLLAGAERYPYHHFLLYDLAGETLGGIIPLSLGYAFAACLKAEGNVLTTFSVFALLLLLAILLIRCIVRKLQSPKEVFAAGAAVGTQKLTEDNMLPESTLPIITQHVEKSAC